MNIKVIIYILIALGTMACRKDKPVPPVLESSDCKPFAKNLPFQTYFTIDRPQFKAPHFNPNNSNEFIYHFRDYEQNLFQLIKYNIQTQQKTLITESGKIGGQPKWGSSGWIAYTHTPAYSEHIFIVKDNGDSLTQFTDNVHNLYPVWNETGDELYWAYSPNLGIPYYFLSQNLNTLIPDTLSESGDVYNGYLRYNAISFNNKLLSLVHINNSNSPYLATASLDEESLSFTSIVNMNQAFDYPSVSGLCWSNNEEYVYVSIGYPDGGLYKIGVNNSNVELLIPFCDTKRYESISASPDGKYLIGERVDSHLELDNDSNPTGAIIENSSIYLIDLNTLEETKINLEP
ncbi:TolB-like translocation protein [Brumimicrobium oceani]|nr:hypothetical protein [Brumimicrobium oceani]